MKTVTLIESAELDKIVTETYKRPYCFQQQDGCRDRGVDHFVVPTRPFDYENDFTLEELAGIEGVPFSVWLSRDPYEKLPDNKNPLKLWWKRNFYPHISMILNDLNAKGLIPSGNVSIEVN